ncbi:MAG: GNAT family N-acetyltransferase [Pseudomonadota bacterium]
MALIIKPLMAADELVWRALWTEYLTFYNSAVDEAVYASTFRRLLTEGDDEPSALLAWDGAAAVGLVHYLFHRHCWRVENVCYLQDLYAVSSARGMGVGRALIEAVYAAADTAGCPTVYWTTAHDNAQARRLYDRIGEVTPFIKYQR